MPTTSYVAPTTKESGVKPLDPSANTRTVPLVPRRSRLMSPLVERVGRAWTTPVVPTIRPSLASPRLVESTGAGNGTDATPSVTKPEVSGRISIWPYGSASGPRTATALPRAGSGTPSGIRTTIPAEPSWIAMSDGVPRRPASAVTTPPTATTVPIGRRRASAMERGATPGVGLGEVPGDALGLGAGVGPGVAVDDGPGVGTGEGVGDVSADGEGP